MIKEYKINQHNSTVCGYPGRDFDWSKFDWDSRTTYDFGDTKYTGGKLKGQRMGVVKAPEVYPDDLFIGEGNQYLHVPYAWNEQATVYRVRPNELMRSGETYRGRLVKHTKAIKKDDGWYWQLEFD